jgi:predicted RNase H-like nuclease (RuvC/YqgF family)
MSESEPREGVTLDQELESLERAVGALLDEMGRLRQRAEAAEEMHERLEATLRQSRVEGADPAALERRLQELGEENDRLKSIIAEAKERALGIRSRLIVIEDETAD